MNKLEKLQSFIGTFDSGGEFPVSLTLYHDLLYVLNAGADSVSPNIAGFRLTHRGELISLAGSTRELGAGGFHQVGSLRTRETLVQLRGVCGLQRSNHQFR